MTIRFWAVAGLALCSATCALADEDKPEIWVNVGGFSSHLNSSKNYNENNAGIGVEYRMSPQTSIMAGSYYNSVRHTTTYAALNWQPYRLGEWKVGLAAGLMDGYPGVVRGGTFFAALPLMTYEGKQLGMNLGIIPNMGNVNGAVVVQFKIRAY